MGNESVKLLVNGPLSNLNPRQGRTRDDQSSGVSCTRAQCNQAALFSVVFCICYIPQTMKSVSFASVLTPSVTWDFCSCSEEPRAVIFQGGRKETFGHNTSREV